jgi:hypothetical protein
LRVASAGKLVGEAFQLTVKPFKFNDFFQGMILVRPQIPFVWRESRGPFDCHFQVFNSTADCPFSRANASACGFRSVISEKFSVMNKRSLQCLSCKPLAGESHRGQAFRSFGDLDLDETSQRRKENRVPTLPRHRARS